jgi:uncharacterized membrane protein YphA (DoxX/SURF4 family)
MNVVMLILQLALAFLYLSGGAYKLFSFDQLASQFTALPHAGWQAVGVIEIVGGILLVLPTFVKRAGAWTPLVCVLLAIETFALAAIYASYSLELAATNPLVWSVVMGVLVAFVGYRRSASSQQR